MNTIRKYSYDMFKLMVDQIGLAMLGLVMTMATHKNDTLYLLTGIFCVVFYVYLIYVMMYDTGKKDKPAVDGGRAKLYPLKGLWIGLGANTVNIICGIMVAVFSFYLVYQNPVAILDQNGNKATVYIAEKATVSTQSSDDTASDTGDETAGYADEDNYVLNNKVYTELYSDSGGEAFIGEKEGYRYSEVVGTSATAKVYTSTSADEEEVFLYTESGMRLSTTKKIVENWATNLYQVPKIIAVFIQPMFAGIRDRFFGNNDNFFYLLTPVLPVFFSALGYYMGVKGKRILFFLPERKQKPKY